MPMPNNAKVQQIAEDLKYFMMAIAGLSSYKKCNWDLKEGILCQTTKYNANPKINDPK